MNNDTPRNPQVRARIGMFYDIPTVASIEKGLREGRFLLTDRLYAFGKDVGSLEETREMWRQHVGDNTVSDVDSDGPSEVLRCEHHLEWRGDNLYLVVSAWEVLIASIQPGNADALFWDGQ